MNSHSLNAPILFFITMPYIGLAVIPFDVQPVALTLSVLAIVFFFGRVKINSIGTILICIQVLSIFGLLLNTNRVNQDLMNDLRAAFGYTSALFIFLYSYLLFTYTPRKTISRVLDFVVFIIFLGFILNISGFTNIIQIFVNRAIFDENSLSMRGLTSFFPEQSRLASQLIYLIALYYFCHSLNKTRLTVLLAMAALSASGQFFINFSVIFIFVFMYYVFSGTTDTNIRIRNLFIVVILIFISYFAVVAIRDCADLLVEMGLPARGIMAFSKLLEFDLRVMGDDAGFLFKVSGPFQGTAAILANPTEIGIGYSRYLPEDSIAYDLYVRLLETVFGATAYPTPPRAYSVLGAWWMDFRIFGFFLSIGFVWSLLRVTMRNKYISNPLSSGIFFGMIFLFATRSNTSDPTFWAVIASICAYSAIPSERAVVAPRQRGRAYVAGGTDQGTSVATLTGRAGPLRHGEPL